MGIIGKSWSLWKGILLLCIFTVQINCIYQACSLDSNCPSNSFCGYRNYCVCNNGWIMNCTTPAQGINANILTATITQSYSYFIISPQNLHEFIKLSIKLSTNQTNTEQLIITLWGQTGYLTDLTSSNQMDTINMQINSSDVQTIETTYFEFGLQPNGENQVIYIGIKLNSTVTSSYLIGVSANQQLAYNQNTFRVVLTILLSVLSVACFVIMGFCIYRRKRMMNQMRQRAEQQKQIKPTTHFDQYMPKVTADRVKMPLQVCSVCLNDIVFQHFVRLTICKHLFHSECIDSWCKKNNSCPICRQELDLQSCQKILGQNFDLSQVAETKRFDEHNRSIQIQMIQHANPIYQRPQTPHDQEIIEENSMRRAML